MSTTARRWARRDLALALAFCVCPPALTLYGAWVVWKMVQR